MTRRCPHCGVAVPTNVLSCPKCFKSIPREAEPEPSAPVREAGNRQESVREVDRTLLIILSTVPALFGLLGLGQIYKDPKDRKGFMFLVIGLPVFLCIVYLFKSFLVSGFLAGILMFAALALLSLIYISAAIGAFIDAVLGSVFKVLRF
ncbi:MAG: hypothetical protein KA502_01050 [Candidatus Methanomethylophilaceae archaeon]|nr:hypothetical protein [Candidatus Methanomethylophilaceae archaeon]